MQHFRAYAGQLNPWFPASIIPLLSWFVTVAEIFLGLSLLAGFQVRLVSLLSGALLLAFAIGMTAGTGVKSPLDASVFSASACALLLWQRAPDRHTLDHLIRRRRIAHVKPDGMRWHLQRVDPHALRLTGYAAQIVAKQGSN